MPTQLLIDGHSLLFRAYHALPSLSTKDGTPTGAVHGFMSMLLRVIEQEKPDRVVVAFDAPHGSFRHQQYAEYKAQRAEAPDEFRRQVPLVYELLQELAIPVLAEPGYEADDTLGTLARMGSERGYQTLIVTGDRDLLQLVDDQVMVLLTSRSGISDLDRMDRIAVMDKMGVPPEVVPDLKGLMGDSSDNIPGVAGIGQKSALKLLELYKSVEDILEKIETIDNPRWRRALLGHEEEARRYRDLATIVVSMPLTWPTVSEPYRPEVSPGLDERLEKLELHAVRRKLAPGVKPLDAPSALQHGVLESPELLPFNEVVTDPDRDYIWLVSEGTRILYDEVDGWATLWEEPGWPSLRLKSWGVKEHCRRAFERGETPPQFVADGKLEAHLLDAERSRYDFKEIAEGYGFGLSGEVAQEARVLGRVLSAQAEELERLGLSRVYREVELPLARVLARMEALGVPVDRDRLMDLGKEVESSIASLEADIYREAGEVFNINSPHQLGEILFVKMGLPAMKRTKTGFSTDADTLEALVPLNPIIEKILSYRQLVKIRGTYVEGLLPLIQSDARIHTTFHQTVTGTGRLSSSDPNLQNIPVRVPLGRRVRGVFMASPGRALLAADYSQIELRMLAHLSGDTNLLQAFQDGEDIHRRTASEIFSIPMDQVDGVWRSRAKAVNFGIIYGISDFGLARDTGVSRSEAKDYIARYFGRYPELKAYFDQVVEEARENGFVTTMLGRRRPLVDIRAANRGRRQYAERMAMNTVIQGSAADLIKVAMVAIAERMEAQELTSEMLLQVHDELIWDAVDHEMRELASLAEREMSGAMALQVPLVVEFKRGTTWESLVPLKDVR